MRTRTTDDNNENNSGSSPLSSSVNRLCSAVQNEELVESIRLHSSRSDTSLGILL